MISPYIADYNGKIIAQDENYNKCWEKVLLQYPNFKLSGGKVRKLFKEKAFQKEVKIKTPKIKKLRVSVKYLFSESLSQRSKREGYAENY